MNPSRPWICAAAVAVLASCGSESRVFPPGSLLPDGTWGGDNAGVIVADTGTHVHIGCVVGDIKGSIALDAHGRFDVAGKQSVTASPIGIAPQYPARFTGHVSTVLFATTLTLTVTVDDTTQHKTVVLGPVLVVLGREPQMGPCPICRITPSASLARALPLPPPVASRARR